MQRWQEANCRYLAEVIRHLKARVDNLLEANIPDAKADLDSAAIALANAETEIAKRNVGAARTMYEVGDCRSEACRPGPCEGRRDARGFGDCE